MKKIFLSIFCFLLIVLFGLSGCKFNKAVEEVAGESALESYREQFSGDDSDDITGNVVKEESSSGGLDFEEKTLYYQGTGYETSILEGAKIPVFSALFPKNLESIQINDIGYDEGLFVFYNMEEKILGEILIFKAEWFEDMQGDFISYIQEHMDELDADYIYNMPGLFYTHGGPSLDDISFTIDNNPEFNSFCTITNIKTCYGIKGEYENSLAEDIGIVYSGEDVQKLDVWLSNNKGLLFLFSYAIPYGNDVEKMKLIAENFVSSFKLDLFFTGSEMDTTELDKEFIKFFNQQGIMDKIESFENELAKINSGEEFSLSVLGDIASKARNDLYEVDKVFVDKFPYLTAKQSELILAVKEYGEDLYSFLSYLITYIKLQEDSNANQDLYEEMKATENSKNDILETVYELYNNFEIGNETLYNKDNSFLMFIESFIQRIGYFNSKEIKMESAYNVGEITKEDFQDSLLELADQIESEYKDVDKNAINDFPNMSEKQYEAVNYMKEWEENFVLILRYWVNNFDNMEEQKIKDNFNDYISKFNNAEVKINEIYDELKEN